MFSAKESTCNAGDPSSIPGLGISPGEGMGYPLWYSWASLVAQVVKNLPAIKETPSSIPGSGRSAGAGIGYPLQYSWASLVAQRVKKSSCNAGDLRLIPGLGRSLGEGKGYPLQYSGLENSMDCAVHRVAKSRTRLSDFHTHFLQIQSGLLTRSFVEFLTRKK